MKDPLVTIACITYNHEKYIRDAIKGFLKQKTTFPIEIRIFDDASTDGTQEIIKKYAEKDDRIITFLMTENQWSRGKYGLLDWIFPTAKGKYIALCEGDDYWTDPYKLQKQVDLMEKNPSQNISFHPAKIINENNNNQTSFAGKYFEKETIIPVENIIKSNGGFMPTASIMLRSKATKKFIIFQNQSPGLPVGDYFLMVIAAVPNGALYFPSISCVYRRNSSSSVTKVLSDPKGRLNFCKKMLIGYNYLDRFLEYEYSRLLNIRKRKFLKWNIQFFVSQFKLFYTFNLLSIYIKNKLLLSSSTKI